MSKPTVFIDDWAVVRSGAYVAYEELQVGNVFGHERLPDAKSIFTSPIIRVDVSQGTVETRNTVYQLGEASEEYKKSDEYKVWEDRRERRYAA
jgi:hypothetical protein